MAAGGGRRGLHHDRRRNGLCGGHGSLLVFLLARGRERLRALRIVAIDGHGLQPQFPGFSISFGDVFDRRFLGHVDRLADRARKERLSRRHHAQVAAPGNRAAAAHRRERAIEHGQVLGLQSRRAFDFAFGVDVVDDLGDILGRVAELHQRLRHRVVDDLDHAAAHQPLLLHEREIRLDAGGVAIHHEADRARGSEDGNLRILVAVFFAEIERRVPRFLGGAEQRRLHVFLLDRAEGIAVHADHVEHGLAVSGIAGERPHALGDARRLRVGLAGHQAGDGAAEIAAAVGIVGQRE